MNSNEPRLSGRTAVMRKFSALSLALLLLVCGCGGGSGESSAASSLSPTVRVTIREGLEAARIFELLEKKGVCSAEKLLEAARNCDFSGYAPVAAIEKSEDRCLLLEGYLFPDTYEFYRGQNPEKVIRKLLKEAQKKYTAEISERAAELGFTLDEIITLASIIEKECGSADELAHVSSVLHNRLKIGMKLQCDVTRIYSAKYLDRYAEGGRERYSDFYDTYKCDGLPAGPICCPGMAAVNAALSPSGDSDLFFAALDGVYLYAETYEQHLENLRKLGI